MSDIATPNKPLADLVQVTEAAMAQIHKLVSEETSPSEGLRLGVQGGGCSGMSYKIAFDTKKEKDYVVEREGVTIFIDPKSAIYLKGLTVDYQGGLEGKGFVFVNPNATSTCGCGESFSV